MPATVTIHSSGKVFTVDDGETILHAALRQGITLPHGCYNGVCGARISRIKSGQVGSPVGPPLTLFGEDAGHDLCCVGHTRGDRVIESVPLGTAREPGE